MNRPFRDRLDLSFSASGADNQNKNWKEMDTDVLDASHNWQWQIDDELAHHVWQHTANSDYVNFGPNPPILLEAFMGFFPSKGLSSSINSWYYTRDEQQSYSDYTTWWDIGSAFGEPTGSPDRTSILYSEDTSPHPLRSKFSSQQYTATGAMFTYEFNQWQGDQPTGMMRIPVVSEELENLRDDIKSTAFEEFQYQSRTYNQQYSTLNTDRQTFAHPHFRAETKTTQDDYMELFDIAFEYMKRSVKIEQV